jgi:death-on-curing protein
VQSAVARPYSGYYRSIDCKVAALVESIATNHGFSDGNKRTAIILMQLLLTKSGYELTPLAQYQDLETAVENLVLDVVTHRKNFEASRVWLAERIRKSQKPWKFGR